MNGRAKGSLIIIGGAEDRKGDKLILHELAERAIKNKGHMTIVTAATTEPESTIEEYKQLFAELGVKKTEIVDIRSREDAHSQRNASKMLGSSVIFFTGGDQLRITSQLGDSPVYRGMEQVYRDGGTIAGTSAGAAVMSQTMLIYGPSDESQEVDALGMASGLGLLRDVVIDTHFAERGRIGRLLSAVVQNPRNLGIGIDENTAILVEQEKRFRVIGEGAIYMVDGTTLTYSSLSEKNPQGIVCMFDVKLHVLAAGAAYDLVKRRPIPPQEEDSGKD